MADWFAQKRYGFGAGLPIAWQGWLICRDRHRLGVSGRRTQPMGVRLDRRRGHRYLHADRGEHHSRRLALAVGR
jgi:hypothetical protein